eukprot:1914225-Rhodomonas_salina.1
MDQVRPEIRRKISHSWYTSWRDFEVLPLILKGQQSKRIHSKRMVALSEAARLACGSCVGERWRVE